MSSSSSSTRIGNIGIGSFLILFFGCIYVCICCIVSTTAPPSSLSLQQPQRPNSFQNYVWVLSTFMYGCFIAFLFLCANQTPQEKDISDWDIQNDPQQEAIRIVVQDTDGYWYTRIFLGILLLGSSIAALLALFTLHLTRPIAIPELPTSTSAFKSISTLQQQLHPQQTDWQQTS